MRVFNLLVLCFMFLAFSTTSFAAEVIYLTDSLNTNVQGGTDLYSVNLDNGTSEAELTYITTFDGFVQVDAVAASVDGHTLYAIDKYCGNAPPNCGDGHLGIYDIATDSFYDMGAVVSVGTTNRIADIVLAAVSPQGELFAASQSTNSLYKINTATSEATLVGQINVNVQGADIAFGADGTLYLWSNATPSGTLYTLTIPGNPVVATFVGNGDGDNFTGLAVRANGLGDLIGSVTAPNDLIRVLDKGNATTILDYPMVVAGESEYNYGYGDLTTGPLVICTRTIGYWKNHAWPGSISLCGQEITEESGKTILWNAKGKNFSMFFAQLIAAKVNVNNATGVSLIDAAENWVCAPKPEGLGIILGELDVADEYNSEFGDKQQKRVAAGYWSDLDEFNNSYECLDYEEPIQY